MARKNIFEILTENENIGTDAERIDRLFDSEKTIILDAIDYKMRNYVDYFCFDDWKNKGHCIDLDDFLETIQYDRVFYNAKNGDVNCFLTLIEIIFNFWEMVNKKIEEENSQVEYYTYFSHLYDIMTECLSKLNHKAVYIEKEEKVLVIEDNPEVTAVAEIMDDNLAYDVIRYNHHSLKGEIELKKAILLKLSNELEPKRKELKALNSKLEDDIFYMFNNLNIRHNNRSKKDKNYKEYVAKMKKDRLEKWYDELYQMILLAFLLLDNKDRAAEVKELRNKVNGGNKKCEQR